MSARPALVRLAALVPVAVLVLTGVAPAAAQDPSPIDCAGPVVDAEPGTPEWTERDQANQYCAEQRHLDKLQHPFNLSPPDEPGADAYREPSLHDDVRFRYDTTVIGGLDAEVYRPCAAGTCEGSPEGLVTFEPPYPAVVSFHGGASRKELHWWSSQSLAEAGYLVIAYDSAGTGPTEEEAKVMLDWLHGDDPLVAEFDGERVGIAGHSGGGVVVNGYGHEDPRVDAIVSWDRAQSTELPADPAPTTPSLFIFADYNCQQVPFCQPEPYLERPDPEGPGNKGQDFLVVRDAGVDTMQLGLRAALHLDWVPSDLAGNRWAEIVTVYFTRAWMDRYVRGQSEPEVAADAFVRLTGETFDDSADVLNISQGLYDPAAALAAQDPYAGNVPYAIADMPVADRLSFYYLSRCFLTAPGTGERVTSHDLRNEGCQATAAAAPGEEPVPPPVPTEGPGLPATGGGLALAAIVLLGAAAALRSRRRVLLLAVVIAATGGCVQNDLSPAGPHRPLGAVPVRGGEGSVEVAVSSNRSDGHCFHWLDGVSCSSDVVGARQTAPWLYMEPPNADADVACSSWKSSTDVVAVHVEPPGEQPLVLRPLPRSREVLNAHFFAACWPAGEVIPRDLEWEPWPYVGVTEDGTEVAGGT